MVERLPWTGPGNGLYRRSILPLAASSSTLLNPAGPECCTVWDRSLLIYPCGKARMKTPEETLRWERVASRRGRMERMIDLDIHEQRRETLRRRALERLRSRRAYPLLPEGLSPLRGGLRVRVVASPIQASMSFERTCAGCRERRGGAGPQPCDRCGEVTETVWRWICARCGRDTQMGAALCPRCRPATRAEKRGGQLRLW